MLFHARLKPAHNGHAGVPQPPRYIERLQNRIARAPRRTEETDQPSLKNPWIPHKRYGRLVPGADTSPQRRRHIRRVFRVASDLRFGESQLAPWTDCRLATKGHQLGELSRANILFVSARRFIPTERTLTRRCAPPSPRGRGSDCQPDGAPVGGSHPMHSGEFQTVEQP